MEDDFEAFERENADMTPDEMCAWLDTFIERWGERDQEEL